MTLVPYNEVVSSPVGAKVLAAQLRIFDPGTDDLVPLYQDADGALALVQPLRSDTEGRFTTDSAGHRFSSFYLAPGIYDEELRDAQGNLDAINPRVPIVVPGPPIAGAMTFKGGWNATTNTPTLVDGTGSAGDVYLITTGGSRDLGSGSIDFEAGGQVFYDGATWQAAPGSEEFSADDPAGAVFPTKAPFITGRTRLRDFYSAKDFGAKGNGDDETTVIQSAIDESRAAGKPLLVPEGVYGISATLTCTDTENPPRIIGKGRGITVFEHEATDLPMFTPTGGGLTSIGTLTAPAAIGDTTITVTTTAGLAAGDTIILKDLSTGVFGDDESVVGNPTNVIVAANGEPLRVRSVTDGTHLVVPRLNWPLSTGTFVTRIDALDGIILGGFTIRGVLGTNTSANARGIPFNYVTDVHLFDLGFEHLDSAGLYFQFAHRILIDGVSFFDMNEGGPKGYGIVAGRDSASGLVRGLVSIGGRHAFTTSASATECPPQYWFVEGKAHEPALTAFDTHPGCRGIHFIRCEVHNAQTSAGRGFQLRGPDCSVLAPLVNGAAIGVGFLNGADRGLLQGGRIRNCATGVYISNTDDVTINGGARIEKPITDGVLIDTETSHWVGHMTEQHLDDLTITGDPSDYAIKQTTAGAPPKLRIGSQVRIPDATRKISGATLPTLAAAATLTPDP